MFVCLFCFFKQKTAYEMRISDWSSDVCSSDRHRYAAFDFPLPVRKQHASFGRRILPRQVCKLSVIILIVEIDRRISDELTPDAQHRSCVTRKDRVPRSEEHTSELQSLMRISYAVFCLKKKKTDNRNTIQ